MGLSDTAFERLMATAATWRLPPPVAVAVTLERQTSPQGERFLAVIACCPYCGLEHTFEAGKNGRAAQDAVRTAPCASPQERRAGSRRVFLHLADEAIRRALHARLPALAGVPQDDD